MQEQIFRVLQNANSILNKSLFEKNQNKIFITDKNRNVGNGIGIGAALGVAFGAAYGYKSGGISQSIALGLAIGVAIGAVFDFVRKK